MWVNKIEVYFLHLRCPFLDHFANLKLFNYLQFFSLLHIYNDPKLHASGLQSVSLSMNIPDLAPYQAKNKKVVSKYMLADKPTEL